MEKKSLEKKFKKRFSGSLKFILDYEDFRNISVGSATCILLEGQDDEFDAYFEGSELDEKANCQRVFLQYEKKIRDNPLSENKWTVTEYLFPLKGRICINDFEMNKQRDYEVE